MLNMHTLLRSGTQTLMKNIQSATHNKTALGKGRALIRASLVSQSLGGLLQEAYSSSYPSYISYPAQIFLTLHQRLQKKKIVEQFYSHDSIFRVDALLLRFLDAIYHLSEIGVKIDDQICVDDGWPSFQAKDFGALTPRRRTTQQYSHSFRTEPRTRILPQVL